jgi:SAM-dependent methyltransferase
MQSVVFNFDINYFEQSVKDCGTSPSTPLILKYLPKKGLVLEAGCGLGNYVKYLSDLGYDIMGVEINRQLVEAVRKIHPEMRIKYGNVNHLDYPDNTFDSMLSLGVVEHTVEGPQTALKEALRVLKPGGVAIITVPLHNMVRRIKYATGLAYLEHFLRKLYYKLKKIDVSWLYQDSLHGNQKFLYPRWPVVGNFFEYHFTPKIFNQLLTDTGFEIIDTLPFDSWGGIKFDFGDRIVRDYEHPSILAKILRKILSIIPYSHEHMYFTFVRKS